MPLIIWICERSKYLSAVKVEFALLLAGLIVMVFTLRPAVFSDGAFRYSVVEAMLNGVKIPSILYSLVQPFLSMSIRRKIFAGSSFRLNPASSFTALLR